MSGMPGVHAGQEARAKLKPDFLFYSILQPAKDQALPLVLAAAPTPPPHTDLKPLFISPGDCFLHNFLDLITFGSVVTLMLI